jgi:hypothetical protein
MRQEDGSTDGVLIMDETNQAVMRSVSMDYFYSTFLHPTRNILLSYQL